MCVRVCMSAASLSSFMVGQTSRGGAWRLLSSHKLLLLPSTCFANMLRRNASDQDSEPPLLARSTQAACRSNTRCVSSLPRLPAATSRAFLSSQKGLGTV